MRNASLLPKKTRKKRWFFTDSAASYKDVGGRGKKCIIGGHTKEYSHESWLCSYSIHKKLCKGQGFRNILNFRSTLWNKPKKRISPPRLIEGGPDWLGGTKEGWVAKKYGTEHSCKAWIQASKQKKKAIGLKNPNKNNFYYIRRYLTALGLRRCAVKTKWPNNIYHIFSKNKTSQFYLWWLVCSRKKINLN